jgi:hypothetical protein
MSAPHIFHYERLGQRRSTTSLLKDVGTFGIVLFSGRLVAVDERLRVFRVVVVDGCVQRGDVTREWVRMTEGGKLFAGVRFVCRIGIAAPPSSRRQWCIASFIVST